MKNLQIKLSLFLNYFVFAILLNSVGTVILQVQNNFGILETEASILEAFKDLSIALVSFLVSSYITRIGYRNAMLVALGFISIVCFLMPLTASFLMTKLLFAAVGSSFALIKMSVYSTIGLVTQSEKEHISFMNFLESFFMVGVLTGYFVFSYFVDSTDKTSTSWLNVYYLLGALSAAAFVLLLTARLDETSVKDISEKPDFSTTFALLKRPVVLVFLVCAFFYVLIEQSIMSWLPTFNNKVLMLSTALSIQMTSILAGSTALGRFLAGVLLRRFSWFAVLLGSVGLAALLVLLALPLAAQATGAPIETWGNAPLAAFIFPLIGLLLAPIYPAINSLILNALPVKNHGSMSGLIIIFSALGGTTGSFITGRIFEHFGGQAAFYFSLVPMGILVVALIAFRRLATA